MRPTLALLALALLACDRVAADELPPDAGQEARAVELEGGKDAPASVEAGVDASLEADALEDAEASPEPDPPDVSSPPPPVDAGTPVVDAGGPPPSVQRCDLPTGTYTCAWMGDMGGMAIVVHSITIGSAPPATCGDGTSALCTPGEQCVVTVWYVGGGYATEFAGTCD